MRLLTQEKLFGKEWIQEYQQTEPDRANFQVDEQDTGFGYPQPDISMNSDGYFVIVWPSVYGGSNYESILAKVYDANGDQVGPIIDVVSHASGSYGPSVALNDDGNFLVAWVDERLNPTFQDVVYAKQYDLAGDVVTPEYLVSVDISGTATRAWPTRLACGNDRFVVVWGEYDNLCAQLRNSDLDIVGHENFPVMSGMENSDNYMFDVDMAAGGDFVIVGVSGEDVYAATYDLDGNRDQDWGDEIRCNEVNDECIYWDVGIGMNDAREWVVAWGSNRDWIPDVNGHNIYAQKYNFLTPHGANFKVNDTLDWLWNAYPDASVANDGNFIITWDDTRNDPWNNSDIYAQIFDSSCNPTAVGNIPIVDFDQLGVIYQASSEVAFLSPSRYAVAFDDDRNSYAQLGVWAQFSAFSFQVSGEYKEISCCPLAYVSAGQSLPGTASFGADHCNEIYPNITPSTYFFEMPFVETDLGELLELPFTQFGMLPMQHLNAFIFSPYALYEGLEYSAKFNKIILPYKYELRFDHLVRSKSPGENIKLYDHNGVEIPKQYYQVLIFDSYRIFPETYDPRAYGPFIVGISQVDCAKARSCQGKNIWGEDWGTSEFLERRLWESEHPESERPTTSGDYDADENEGYWNRIDDGRYTVGAFEDFYVSEAGFWGQDCISGHVIYTDSDSDTIDRGVGIGDATFDISGVYISGECYPISLLTSYKYLSGDDYYDEEPKRIVLLLPEFLCFQDGLTVWVEYNKFVRYIDHRGAIVEYFHPRYREIINPRLLARQNKDYMLVSPDGVRLYFAWIVEALNI